MDKYNEGRPDVVFMVHDPAAHSYIPGEGLKVTSYDEAEAIQRRALSARNNTRTQAHLARKQEGGVFDQNTDFNSQTVGTATGAKANTDFFAQAKAELKTDDISAVARRAQELKESSRPVNGLFSKEREQENLAPTWYLKSNQLVDSRMQGPMPADATLKMLENNGVKPDELKYTGLSDFLKEKGSAPVRPEELKSYLDANNLQIKEVTKGGPYQTYGENGETKFESHTLPGANPGSYRELLMTLPGKFMSFEDWIAREGASEPGGSAADRAMYERIKNRGGAQSDSFRSSHWDEVNPVGHVRFNDRTGPNGEKLLHLEELQSDMMQKMRKSREAIHTAISGDAFYDIIKRMEKDGTLEVEC
jgi:hypothetical protein